MIALESDRRWWVHGLRSKRTNLFQASLQRSRAGSWIWGKGHNSGRVLRGPSGRKEEEVWQRRRETAEGWTKRRKLLSGTFPWPRKSGILLVSSPCPFQHALKTHLREEAVDVHQDRHFPAGSCLGTPSSDSSTGAKPCEKSGAAQRMEQSICPTGKTFPCTPDQQSCCRCILNTAQRRIIA